MLHIPEIVTALQDKYVTAAAVAKIYSLRGQRLGDGYNIVFTEPPVRKVIIGLERGRHTLSLPPEDVTLSFSEPLSVGLLQAVPFCKQSNESPNTRERPWSYSCRLEEKGRLPIILYASLSGDNHEARAILSELIIQKGLPLTKSAN